MRDLAWVGATEPVKTGRSRLCKGLQTIRVYAARTRLELRRRHTGEVVAELTG